MADSPVTPGPLDPKRGSIARNGQVSPKAGGAGARTSENKSDGVAFRALLEKLEEKARALEETSRTVDDAAHLAGAVEGARASLEDALSLGEELLESYRQSRHQSPEEPQDRTR